MGNTATSKIHVEEPLFQPPSAKDVKDFQEDSYRACEALTTLEFTAFAARQIASGDHRDPFDQWNTARFKRHCERISKPVVRKGL